MTNESLITTAGKKVLLNRGYKNSPDYTAPSQFKVGVSQSDVSVSDTDLTLPVPISGTELADNCETVGNWAETTEGSDSLNSSTYKEGSGALNIIKTGTTQSSLTVYAANTLTSLTFTSKTLFVWLYIKDATAYAKLVASGTAVQLRYGIDYNTNYYYRNYTKAQLAIGWNVLNMSTSTGTAQGTPGTTSFDSGALVITFTSAAQELAAGDLIMDEWKLASSDDYLKVFLTGYPTLDETNSEVAYRCYIDSTEANGYPLEGVGIYNTDASPILCSEDKMTAESKSSSDEFTFIIVDRLV